MLILPLETGGGGFNVEISNIIGLSVSKNHLAGSPEIAGMDHFTHEVEKAGHDHSKMLLRFKVDQPIDYSFLEQMIEFNIQDKADYPVFWRKEKVMGF